MRTLFDSLEATLAIALRMGLGLCGLALYAGLAWLGWEEHWSLLWGIAGLMLVYQALWSLRPLL